MKKCVNKAEETKKVWISITGYRALLILKSLLKQDYTINELIDILKRDKNANKAVSKDTVRIAINTLKLAGCKFSKPNKANSYKYQLLEHPFVLNLSEKELKTLIKLRDKYSQEISWDSIFHLNDLYDKIISLTFNESQIQEVMDSKPLQSIKREILDYLSNPALIGKKVEVCYRSPEFGEENIEILPKKIVYENQKLYLWCYSFKYKHNSLLSIERIISINKIDIVDAITTPTSYDVVYEVIGNSVTSFVKKDFEEILEQNEGSIKVIAHVDNEFLFIQRILLFGTDFKIISPDFFKEKLIGKIKLIQRGYK